jgi:hypothetical protein
MDPNKASKSLALLSAVAALLVVPSNGPGASPFGGDDVCADGSCCISNGNICEHAGHDHDNYEYKSGACS